MLEPPHTDSRALLDLLTSLMGGLLHAGFAADTPNGASQVTSRDGATRCCCAAALRGALACFPANVVASSRELPARRVLPPLQQVPIDAA